jgi:Nucleotidyl transferase AbiEii toxin, Type IV TA system
MSNKLFYEVKLYPLQDKVLALVDKNSKVFYLTGGTALHRFYNGFRYSDDLDFFTLRGIKNFREHVGFLLSKFSDAGLTVKADALADSFARITFSDGKASLKVDFVNDPVFRWGKVKRFKPFSRVDNEINILSNKITAITRYEVKDIVDIGFIAGHQRVVWQEVINIASKKSPVDPLEVGRIISNMPEEELKSIEWSKRIDLNTFYRDLQVIARKIVTGGK